MRAFLYEYTCAQPCASPSLCREGWAMLSALLEDFGKICDVATLRSDGFQPPPDDEESAFRELAATADFSLVIAPEFDDLLATRCLWVEQARGRLLACSQQAIRLTADKLALANHFVKHGIPTPATWLAVPPLPGTPGRGAGGEGLNRRWQAPTSADSTSPLYPCAAPPECRWKGGLIAKPRFGAGSQSISLISNADAIPPDFIVQEYIPGLAASIAFLLGREEFVPLQPAQQLLSDDGKFRYLGGRLPLTDDLRNRAVQLGRRAVETVPGLFGYVGVDLVLGDTPAQDAVIEINPRLTTSYIGLRQATDCNLAAAMMRIALGEPVGEFAWRSTPVAFRLDQT